MSMNCQSLHCFPPLEAPIPFKDFYNQLIITTAFRIAYKLSIQKNEQISNERSTLKGGKGGRSGEVSFAPIFNFPPFRNVYF